MTIARTAPAILALAALSCRAGPPFVVDSTSTADMLEQSASALNAEALFVGEPWVVDSLAEYRRDSSSGARQKRIRLAEALVRVGRTEDGAQLYDELFLAAADLEASGGDDDFLRQVELPRAVAHLRLGEQENCVAHVGAASCLFPLAPSAIHEFRRGSERAIDALSEIVRRDPPNLSVKWLLNLAYMTLGRYPGDVPHEWLIPARHYRSEYEMEPFVNRASALGVAAGGASGGCVVDDFDGDGHLDIMVSTAYPIDGPRGQLQLFRNEGDGSFTDVTNAADLTGILGGLNLVQADYDNDGHVDVFVLRGAWHQEHGRWPNTLLRNNGDGTFSDVTVEAGVLSFHPTQTAAWGDYDGDGWIDLFVGNESGVPGRPRGAIPGLIFDLLMFGRGLFKPELEGHLFRNNGDGTFVDVFPDVDLDIFGWVKGVAWGDYDRDGRIDLYVSRFGDPNRLYRNGGPDGSGGWKFTDVSDSAGVTEPWASFATWFWDYDNDGWPDIFVAGYPRPTLSDPGGGLPAEFDWSNRDEIAEFLGEEPSSADGKPCLYRNNGDGTFTDVTKAVGLYRSMSPMGANFGDLDNDGFLDLYLGTGAPPFSYLVPNRLFRSSGGELFQDVTVSANVGHLQKGHAIAFGDIDSDGDQDIYAVLGGAFPGDTSPNALFINPGSDNSWITLKLEGSSANRAAIGAVVKLTVAGRSGERTIFRTVGSGGSFGASSLEQEIGLGDAEIVRELEIIWPDGRRSVEEFADLEPNSSYHIRQGEGVRREGLEGLTAAGSR